MDTFPPVKEIYSRFAWESGNPNPQCEYSKPGWRVQGRHSLSLPCRLRSATSPADLRTKKAIFDQVMVIRRMQEEEQIVVQEMRRHLNSLIGVAGSLKTLLLDQSNGAHCGYHSMLRRRLSVVNAQVHHTKASFSLALHGEMTSQDMLSEDREEQVSDVEDTSDDDNDIDSS
ncbi:hypothetical protein SRHO_G00312450 [Serrasalmus rhombeus]